MVVRLQQFAPLSAARKARALQLLSRKQRFWAISTDDAYELTPESSDYAATRPFETRIDEYFGYRIDYYPLYNERLLWSLPMRWIFFSDINDEITEEKFRSDQDIRAFITAYRMTVEMNRRGIILLKRLIQAIVMSAWLCWATVLSLGWKSSTRWLIGAVIVTVILWFYQITRDSQLRSIIESNGKNLANKLQDRVNNLNKNFIEFLAGIDREEASDDMTDPEWTHRSAWWMQLAMWNPKRIEYIEKFLQSEMQRTRIFILRTGLIGRAVAITLLVAGVLGALAFHGVNTSGGDVLQLFNGGFWLDMLAPSYWSGRAAILWLGVAVSFAAMFVSLRSSIKLVDIANALGKEPLGKSSRFADIDLHKKLAEQVRRDKEKLRQDKLAGGYAENKKSGRAAAE